MPDTAILSKQFRLSIPRSICTTRNWTPGQTFAFIPKGAGVLLVPVPARDDLSGLSKGARNRAARDRADRF